jgi:type II secretory pathway pseudopilin PulG
MKKFNKYVLPLLLIVVMAFVSTCKKDEEEPPTFQSLTFNEEEIINRIPDAMAASNDENAQACVDAIESAADWSSFYSYVTPPSDATKVGSKSTNSEGTWKWTSPVYGNIVVTFYWTYEETSTKDIWSMDVQYNDGPKYDYIDMWQLKDGTQGEIKYNFAWACAYDPDYYEDCTDWFWTITWNKNASGVINYTCYWDYTGTEYAYLYRWELVSNPDGSGTLDYYYLDDYWHYHYEWDALGNGTWVWYMSGDIYGSGSWTV